MQYNKDNKDKEANPMEEKDIVMTEATEETEEAPAEKKAPAKKASKTAE